MGTCCNKDKQDVPRPSPAPEQPPVFRLQVSCEEYQEQLMLNLSPDLPLSALKDMILRKAPLVDFKKFRLRIGHKELADDTATLRQLLIQSGDHVRIERAQTSASVSVERRIPRQQPQQSFSQDSRDPTKRESEMQASELVESEDHIRHEAANSRPTHAMLRRRLRDMSNEELKAKAEKSREISDHAKGKRLWETALKAAPPYNRVRLEDLNMSSTTNRSNEQSLKERYFPTPTLITASRNHEQSIVYESDDSLNEDENRRPDKDMSRHASHPSDFFHELHGLYSNINKA